MKQIILFLSAIALLSSCQSKKMSDEEFKEKALELIAEMQAKNEEHNQQIQALYGFSKETMEVINWYELNDQRYDEYFQYAQNFQEVNSMVHLKILGAKDAETVDALQINLPENEWSLFQESGYLSKFQNLKYLKIGNVSQLPVDIGDLPSLEILELSYVYDLQSIPVEISKLKNLEHFALKGLNKVKSLPAEIYNLKKLKSFILTGAHYDLVVDENISKWSNLRVFTADCVVSSAIGQLKKLNYVKIDAYTDSIPYQAIYSLPLLKTLGVVVNNESQLKGIGKLQGLEVLHLYSSFINEEVGSLGNLIGLIISGYNNPEYPSSLGKLQKLEALKIGQNNGMKVAPAFIPNLTNLAYLEIRGCGNLESFPDSYGKMKNLKLGEVFYNEKITSIPDELFPIQEAIKIENL